MTLTINQDFSKQGHCVDIKTLFPGMITDFRSVFRKKRQKWTIFLLKTPWDNNSVHMSTDIGTVTQKGKQTSENLF